MKSLKKLSILFLFFIIGTVSIVNVYYYDDYLLSGDKQIFIRNLKNNSDKISEVATRNNIIIYSKNVFERRYDIANDSKTPIIENTVYSNVDLKWSPFYLSGKSYGSYKTFANNKKTMIKSLKYIENQRFSDFWIIDNNNNLDKFLSELTQENIEYTNIEVDSDLLHYDYKTEYYIAIAIVAAIVVIATTSLNLLASKEISLKKIYQNNHRIVLSCLVKTFYSLILAFVFVLLILVIVLFSYNKLSRFDIVFEFYLVKSILVMIVILCVEGFILLVILNKISIISAINGYIPNLLIFKVLNIVLILSLVLASNFIYSFFSYTSFLKTDNEFETIKKYDTRHDKYILYLMNRYSVNSNPEIAALYNEKINYLSLTLQQDFDAVVFYYTTGKAYVNANYFKFNKVVDKNLNVVKANDIRQTVYLDNPIKVYDHFEKQVVTVQTLNQIKFKDFYMTGAIDMSFDYVKFESRINKMILNDGVEDVVNGIASINHDSVNKQENETYFKLAQTFFNFGLFIFIYAYTVFIQFGIYMQINKKEIALRKHYGSNFMTRYKKMLVNILINYSLILLIGKNIFEGEISVLLVIGCYLINVIIILLYSSLFEDKNTSKWLSGG